MATRRVFAGRWTEEHYQCSFVCMSIALSAIFHFQQMDYTWLE